jgi:O-antigen ligase
MTEATQPQPPSLACHAAENPAPRRDDWAACRDRASWLLRAHGLLLLWLFGLVFGLADAVIAGNSTGWIVAGALVALFVVAVGADHIKFWVTLYPLVFLSARFQLGDLSEGGDKLLGLQLFDPWILLLLCLWIPRLLAAKRLELPLSMKVMLGALFVLGLFAIRIAPDRMSAIKNGGRTFFEPLLLFVLVTSLSWKRTELRRVIFALLAVATMVAGASFFSTGDDTGKDYGRLQSYWEGTNVLAAFLGTVIPVALGAALSGYSRMRVILCSGALLATSAALVFTFTRGTWLAVSMALGLMIGLMRAWVWAALALLVILAAVLAGPSRFVQRLGSIANFEEERSASNRLMLWPEVAKLIADRPLTGYGFSGFQVLFRKQSTFFNSFHAHNIFLDAALTFGIPGLLLFFSLVGYVVVRAFATLWRFRKSEDWPLLLGLWTGSIAMLLAGLTDGSITIWPILAHAFWFVLGLTYAVTVSVERELRLTRQAVAVMPRSQ